MTQEVNPASKTAKSLPPSPHSWIADCYLKESGLRNIPETPDEIAAFIKLTWDWLDARKRLTA